MEALQIIKYSIRNDLIDFTAGGSATEKDLTSHHTSEDLLAQLIHTAGQGTSYREDIVDRILQELGDETGDEGKEDSQDDWTRPQFLSHVNGRSYCICILEYHVAIVP